MYRDEINSKVVAAIEPEAEVWGVKLLRYEVKDIDPPDRIRNTMIKQAEAERNKRGDILTSEGSKIAEINRSEAMKKQSILEAEGRATFQIL